MPLLMLDDYLEKSELPKIDEMENLFVYQNSEGLYELRLNNGKNVISSEVESYKIIKKQNNYLFIEVIENNFSKGRIRYIYKISLKDTPYSTQEGLNFIFEKFCATGKYNITSTYTKFNSCIISSVLLPFNQLSYSDQLIIKRFFRKEIFFNGIKKKLESVLKIIK